MSIVNRAKEYYSIAGIKGLATFAAYRLFGAPKEVTFRPRNYATPLSLRLNTSDAATYWEILGGEYAFDVPFQPKVILDAGANIGLAAIYFANKYPQAKVVAVEAEASNFELLLRNCRSYPSIVPIHAALWNHNGEIVVTDPDPVVGAPGKWAFITRDTGEGDRVRAVTLPTLMQELNIESFDIAKIDIEGGELELFEDPCWVETVRCVMIELHDRFRPGCTKVVDAALLKFARSQRGPTSFYLRTGLPSSVA